MKKISIPLCLILLLLVGRWSPITAQNDATSDAPYIYYYSDILNAFVIERADGTDSRVFGDGLMADGTRWLNGAGWSPSGEWFAWSSSRDYINWPVDDNAFILNIDGERRVTVLDSLNGFAGMEWSPTQDILAVRTFSDLIITDANEYVEATYYFIDPAQDEILFTFETHDHPEGGVGLDGAWHPDGEHFFTVREIRQLSNSDDYGSHFHVITMDGEITSYEYPIHRTLNFRSPTGVILNISDDNISLVSTDMITGEQQSYPLPNGEIVRLSWAITGDGVLFITDNNIISIWYFSASRQLLSTIQDNVHFERGYSTGRNWSPDGKYVVFKMVNGDVGYFDTETWTIALLFAVEESLVWATFWDWSKDNHLYTTVLSDYNPEVPRIIDVFDLSDNSHTQVSTMLRGDLYQFSPHEHYVMSFAPAHGVENLVSGTYSEFRYHSGAAFGGGIYEVRWHESEEWILLAGGESNYRLVSIATPDNLIYRELGTCYFTMVCANWLPDEVDIEALPEGSPLSAISTPDRTISNLGSYFSGFSWSPDGNWIAAIPQWEINSLVINVETGRVVYRLLPSHQVIWDCESTQNCVAQTDYNYPTVQLLHEARRVIDISPMRIK